MIEIEMIKVENANIIKDSDIHQVTSYWSCDACGGDSDDGCQMSDPQNCVRR